METKVCGNCNLEQSICEFGKDKKTKTGYRRTCNTCRREESKIYREKYPERRKETSKKYYNNNKEEVLSKTRSYKKKNKEKVNKGITKYVMQRYNSDPLFKLIYSIRNRTKQFLFSVNFEIKKNNTFNIVGCSPQFLKEYLENKFVDGMSWSNHGFGGWHIDHIIPLSSAKNEEEVYKLCHYTNLQPLWAKDNLSKGGKILI